MRRFDAFRRPLYDDASTTPTGTLFTLAIPLLTLAYGVVAASNIADAPWTTRTTVDMASNDALDVRCLAPGGCVWRGADGWSLTQAANATARLPLVWSTSADAGVLLEAPSASRDVVEVSSALLVVDGARLRQRDTSLRLPRGDVVLAAHTTVHHDLAARLSVRRGRSLRLVLPHVRRAGARGRRPSAAALAPAHRGADAGPQPAVRVENVGGFLSLACAVAAVAVVAHRRLTQSVDGLAEVAEGNSSEYIKRGSQRTSRMRPFATVVWTSIAASWALFVLMFCLLDVMGVYEADFFNFTKDVTVLGHPIQQTWQVVVLVFFFFLNAFVNQWNGVVLDPIFGQLVLGDARAVDDTGLRRSRLFPLLAVYQIWGGAQWFFGITGATSHVGFLMASIAGSVSGGLLTRWMFLQPSLRPYIHHDHRRRHAQHGELKPLTTVAHK